MPGRHLLFLLKTFFVVKIFKFFPGLFRQVEIRRYYQDKVNFKFYYVATWLANNYTTNIA